MASNRHIGSGFDEFLAADGLLDEVSAVALKRVIAWQVSQAMTDRGISKAALADRMGTSRSQVDRLLDQETPGMTLDSLSRAAEALELGVRVTLVARTSAVERHRAKVSAASASWPKAAGAASVARKSSAASRKRRATG